MNVQEISRVSAGEVQANTPNCRNCGAKLSGKFCSHCGQNESNTDLRFVDLMGELFRDFLAWDSGVWRTLAPLLFRPGFLTAEFLSGRKARYLPPLRLYLVISFFMFLLISMGSIEGAITIDRDLTDAEKNEAIGKMEVQLQAGDMTEEQKSTIRKHTLNHLEKGIVTELDAVVPEGNLSAIAGTEASIDFWDKGEKPAWATDLEKRFTTNVKSIEQDPGIFVESFVERLPYMMFLLLPLFAILVRICYFFSPFHYLQHLVFSLHYHCAVFLLLSAGMILNSMTELSTGIWIMLWSLLYLPLALVRVYGSSYGAAFGKSLLIGFGELLLLVFTLSALAVFSVATL
jgi:hypothetical protein